MEENELNIACATLHQLLISPVPKVPADPNFAHKSMVGEVLYLYRTSTMFTEASIVHQNLGFSLGEGRKKTVLRTIRMTKDLDNILEKDAADKRMTAQEGHATPEQFYSVLKTRNIASLEKIKGDPSID